MNEDGYDSPVPSPPRKEKKKKEKKSKKEKKHKKYKDLDAPDEAEQKRSRRFLFFQKWCIIFEIQVQIEVSRKIER